MFNPFTFRERVKETYRHPLAEKRSWLCILNLVFAIGLQFFSDSDPGSPSTVSLDELGINHPQLSETFFTNAKRLKDPISGVEDGDYISIDALLLTTLYMLAIGKRNTAWGYFGKICD